MEMALGSSFELETQSPLLKNFLSSQLSKEQKTTLISKLKVNN